MSIATVAVTGVSFLNQDCVHLPRQMVFKTHAVDLDLLDREQTRRWSQPRSATANSLPAFLSAISVNKIKQVWSALAQRSGDSALDRFERTETSNFATSISKAPSSSRSAGALQKKENQCQES